MFIRKKSQLLRLCRQVGKMHREGIWVRLEPDKKNLLRKRLYALWLQVKPHLDRKELRRVMATLAFILGLSFASSAQVMGPMQLNPFGLDVAPEGSFYLAGTVDIDGDGDLDILGTQYFYYSDSTAFVFIENTGTASNPQFASPTGNTFGLATSEFFMTSSFIDLDNDGDLDLLGLQYDYPHSLIYYENTGSASNPAFSTPVSDPFGFDPSDNYGYFAISAGDLDNDGDYDLIYMGEYETLYFENTGTASNPAFAAPVQNPFNLNTENMAIFHSALGDVDKDGDLDIIAIDMYESLGHFKNIGNASNPDFASPAVNPFGMSSGEDRYTLSVSLADMDGDGDLDILLTDYYYDNQTYEYSSNFLYYENTNPAVIEASPVVEGGLTLYPQPCSGEVTLDLGDAVEGQYVVNISDITGKQLLLFELSGGTPHTINLNGLAPGMYIIDVSGNGYHTAGKLYKQD